MCKCLDEHLGCRSKAYSRLKIIGFVGLASNCLEAFLTGSEVLRHSTI